ncbi:hypothetical protein ATL41_0576 [Flavimobilis soli]|uniref:Purine nucleoside phosphorylase n=1 Tax=Flavimobilis soli TaxID=442709 RepID=A0A2A9EB43_9MICO|nr:peptidoglycan editing factor PgeF [Flavimobilis soli]PFG35876.1 hypothetical protein ATL41_0576 [Flavimobilis soli]
MTDPQHGPRTIELDLGPGVRAVFTTVHGGVSSPPWASLNLGMACGDDQGAVVENRRRVGAAVGAPVAFATQVHGADVVDVAGADAVRELPGTVGEADGLVTSATDVALGVLVADCVPVLLADPEARVVAVAHAGRRGVESEVVLRTLDAMVARGADPARVRAAVGPCACGDCYEVPEDMRADVAARVPATWSTTSWGTPALDLAAGVEQQLDRAGVASVTRVARCTIEDDDLFSYRRAGRTGDPTTGRFAGVVRITVPGR